MVVIMSVIRFTGRTPVLLISEFLKNQIKNFLLIIWVFVPFFFRVPSNDLQLFLVYVQTTLPYSS